MTEDAKRERAEYQRQWRKKNPDKVRKNNERYWENRIKRNLAQQQELKQEGEHE